MMTYLEKVTSLPEMDLPAEEIVDRYCPWRFRKHFKNTPCPGPENHDCFIMDCEKCWNKEAEVQDGNV
jgi:hypothetical protein